MQELTQKDGATSTQEGMLDRTTGRNRCPEAVKMQLSGGVFLSQVVAHHWPTGTS